MANIYVYSGAAGTGSGADWTNAYTTLKAAAEAAGTAAGDEIDVAHDHNESSAVATTITFKGTYAAPTRVLCVNRAGSVPPVAADLRNTAVVTTTGLSTLTLTAGNFSSHYFEGFNFNIGSGVNSVTTNLGGASICLMDFRNCAFRNVSTNGNPTVTIGSRALIRWFNCTLQSAIGANNISVTGRFQWFGGSVLAAVSPLLVSGGASAVPTAIIDGVDLTLMGASSFFCGGGGQQASFRGYNCKLPTPFSLTSAITSTDDDMALINCDSGGTNYRTEKATGFGNQVQETTIVRTGGASDGTTSLSWKLVSNGNAKITNPFISLPITVWNDTPGAKTVSIYGYWNNAAVPTNAQIFMEAEYLGSAGSPLSSKVNSGPATVLSAGANIPSDASAWGGGVTTSKFKMGVSLTTAMKGPITVVVYVAAVSGTFYIDPKIEVV